MVKRVCLYGGPGIGKTKLARYIASELAEQLAGVELIDEFVKGWAYQGIRPEGWDQFYVFGCQLHKEEFLLRRGLSVLVTDSPVLLQCCYMTGLPYQYQLINVARDFDKDYPSLHIILEREDFGRYDDRGRYEKLEAAVAKDKEIDIIVRAYAVGDIWVAKPSQKDKLVEDIASYIGERS